MNQLQHGSSAVPDILPAQDSLFYNRDAEQTRFNDKFAANPKIMTVLVGPPNCGKTVRSESFTRQQQHSLAFPRGFRV
jgi:hypothetical protein